MKRIETAHMPVVARTHPGMTGKNNEDRYGVSAFSFGRGDVPVLLAVLCDGIGGHKAGEVAAEMAVNGISHAVAASDGRQPLEALRTAVRQTGEAIFAQSQANGEQRGMGATLSCAYIQDRSLYTATVGDSRIFLLRGGRLSQLSTDHTWIQEALENGILTPDQVKGHPNAHVIRRFLGSPVPPEPDFRLKLSGSETNEEAEANQGLALETGDVLLLCSDGLTDLVTNQEIEAVLGSMKMDEAADILVSMACQRGGHDNITLILIQVPEARPVSKRKWPRLALFGGISLVVLLILLGLLFALTGWLDRQPVKEDGGTPAPFAQTVGPGAATELETLPPLEFPTETPKAVTASPSGPTITPWPTHTFAPSPSPTRTQTNTP